MKTIVVWKCLIIVLSAVVCQDNNSSNVNVYDFIIVGAGSGGSVVANRLSENPEWKILLVEAGEEENFFTDIPLMAAFQSTTRFNWGYRSEKLETACLGLKFNRCNMPRGKGVGGTSIINFLLYSRGNKKDFDEWYGLGNTGWDYSSVLPYFIKSEKCSKEIAADFKYRGTSGHLQVEYPPFETALVKNFLKTGREMGYKISDPNGQHHIGFSKVQATMRQGRRCSVAKAYLSNLRKRSNLKILTRTQVKKLLIDPIKNEAKGIEFMENDIKIAYASKEIILSAGAINSPYLLMISGIGPKKELEQANISVVNDLKVGYNLQDHLTFGALVFLLNSSITVSDQSVQNPVDILNYVINGKGPFTIPGGAEALAFLKTKYSLNKTDDYPDIELVLGAGGLNGDIYGSLRNLLGIPNSLFNLMYRPFRYIPGFGIAPVLMRPKSKGRVLLDQAHLYDKPIIQPNYLSDKNDVFTMVEGIKMAINISQSRYFQRYNATLLPVPFPWCKNVSFNSDEYWACAVRHVATTLGHQVGTCKMGPNTDPEAVVDPTLKVYGVKNLRVVDGSIMPNIVSGHTNAVIVMIAEKASDMIINEWSK